MATVRPAGDSVSAGWTLALASGDTAAAELIQNLLLFLPLGLTLAAGGLRWRPVLLAGVALSCTVEFLQQWIPGRDPSVGDIVANGLSAALGGALVWTAPRWLDPPAYRAAWLSLGAAAVAATVWLGTGWLLQPAFPHTVYYDRWTPDIPKRPNYKGAVVAATLGPIVLQQGPVGGATSDLGPTLLAAGAPLRIRAIAGPPPGGRSPLLTISDAARRDIFIVGVDREDLLIVYRTRAVALTLGRPDLRARHALAGARPGDTITVATRREAPGRHCINQSCGHGYTIGDAWKLIFFPAHFPPWALRWLNALWVGGGLVGVGLWGRRHPASGAALALAAATLALGPGLVALAPTPLGEWAGAVGGCVLGWGCARRARLANLRQPGVLSGRTASS